MWDTIVLRGFPWNAPSQILTKATVEPAAYRAELAIAHLCTVELDEGGASRAWHSAPHSSSPAMRYTLHAVPVSVNQPFFLVV